MISHLLLSRFYFAQKFMLFISSLTPKERGDCLASDILWSRAPLIYTYIISHPHNNKERKIYAQGYKFISIMSWAIVIVVGVCRKAMDTIYLQDELPFVGKIFYRRAPHNMSFDHRIDNRGNELVNFLIKKEKFLS